MSVGDAIAIQQLFSDATHAKALNAIINDVCGAYSPAVFCGEKTHQTSYELGKREVALILLMLKDIDLKPYQKD
jgi:hypothetical protein